MGDKVQLLMVEDSASAAFVAKKAINGSFGNAEVITAKDLPSATQIAKDGKFSGFIVDNELPGGKGVDFIAALRKGDYGTAQADAPVFFLSSADQDVHDQARQAAGDRNFDSGTKGADMSKLVEFLARNVAGLEQAKATSPGTPGSL